MSTVAGADKTAVKAAGEETVISGLLDDATEVLVVFE
jgi:hypothetical protein